MRFILLGVAVVIAIFGVVIYNDAKAIFQQIAGLVILLNAATLLAAAAIVDSVVASRKRLSSDLSNLARHVQALRSERIAEVTRLQQSAVQQSMPNAPD